MALMSWTVELSVNIDSIDAQHRELVDLLNKFKEATDHGAAREVVGRLLAEGLKLTTTHFAYEEKLMRENGYQSYAEHKKEHESLVVKVKEMAQYFASGKRLDLRGIEIMLRDWWLKHIKTVDKAYSAFLVSKGVK